MATFVKFNSLTQAVAEKKHNFASDQLVVALCASANAPVATNTVLANLTQISYTGLSSRNITTSSSSQTSGTYKLVVADLTLTASATVAGFRYVVVYNSTATNSELVGYIDYGSDLVLNNGDTFTIDFDNTNGLFTIG